MTVYSMGASLQVSSLTPSIQEQLVCTYQPAIRDNLLMVTVIPFQQQEGTSDCGLFSIAAAYHTAKNDDLQLVLLYKLGKSLRPIACTDPWGVFLLV